MLSTHLDIWGRITESDGFEEGGVRGHPCAYLIRACSGLAISRLILTSRTLAVTMDVN